MNEHHELTTESIENQILANYSSLPKNQKSVADFIISNMNEAAFLSVIEIGKKCGASKATVVRFAQGVGYDGFLDFRNALHKAVQDKFTHIERFPLEEERGNKQVINIAKQDVHNINTTLESLNQQILSEFVDVLSGSHTIYTFGEGMCEMLCEMLSYFLSRIGRRSQPLNLSSALYERELLMSSESDCLIVMSFPPHKREVCDAADLAREQGVTVLALTDSRKAPIIPKADHSLLVKTDSQLFTKSFSAISMMINVLVHELATIDKKETIQFLEKSNELLKKNYRYRKT
jgi:DNA-binding MurR/RpiR family transcriptional regulator